jgi:hypothetical protein
MNLRYRMTSCPFREVRRLRRQRLLFQECRQQQRSLCRQRDLTSRKRSQRVAVLVRRQDPCRVKVRRLFPSQRRHQLRRLLWRELRPAPAVRPEKPASDDLLSIALQEQRDDRRRRNERMAERQKRQVLVPCTCGAWLRVHEEFAGKVVRCKQCRSPIQIPEIRRRTVEKRKRSLLFR